MNTLAFRAGATGDKPFLVVVHTQAPPAKTEWLDYVRRVRETLAARRGVLHVFIATDGGAPDAEQCEQLSGAFGEGTARVHLYADDACVRGAVLDPRWTSGAVPHRAGQFARACVTAGHSPEHVVECFAAARRDLPRVATLESLVASVALSRTSAGGF